MPNKGWYLTGKIMDAEIRVDYADKIAKAFEEMQYSVHVYDSNRRDTKIVAVYFSDKHKQRALK